MIKRNEVSSHEKTGRNLTLLSERSNYMTFWKKQNFGGAERISGFQGLAGREGRTRRVQRSFGR